MKKKMIILILLMFFGCNNFLVKADTCMIMNEKNVIVKTFDCDDIDTNGLVDGYYYIGIEMKDKAGNSAVSKMEEFIIDHTPPNLEAYIKDNILYINFKDNLDNNPKITYLVNGDEYDDISKVVNLNNITIKVVDHANNIKLKEFSLFNEARKINEVFINDNKMEIKNDDNKKEISLKWQNLIDDVETKNKALKGFTIDNILILDYVITIVLLLPLLLLLFYFLRIRSEFNKVIKVLFKEGKK